MAQLVERNQVGKREDLADIIAVVDSKDTPFYSSAPKGKAPMNSLQEWQVDKYGNIDMTGAKDGDDITNFNNESPDRVRMKGRIQKFAKGFGVSDLAENVSDVAGLGQKGEMNRSGAKALVEIKRNIESRLCSDLDSQVDDGTQGYQTRGLGSWISNTAQSDLPVDSRYLTPTSSLDGTATASITDDTLQGVLTSIFQQTGQSKDLVLLTGPTYKRAISKLALFQKGVSATVANARLFNQDANSKKIIATIDFYQGDFGAIQLRPSLFLARDSDVSGVQQATSLCRAFVLDFNNVEIAFNRLPRIVPLEDRGGGPRSFVDAIVTLKVYNPLSLGKFNPTA
jgi:hypothetical protein